MLVLSRKPGEQIRIGDDITLTVIQIQGNRIRLGIDAPRHRKILRGELEQMSDTPSRRVFFAESAETTSLADLELTLIGNDEELLACGGGCL